MTQRVCAEGHVPIAEILRYYLPVMLTQYSIKDQRQKIVEALTFTMNPNIKYNKNRFVRVEIFPSTANCGRYSIIQSFDIIMR
jgi:hypothetical protein